MMEASSGSGELTALLDREVLNGEREKLKERKEGGRRKQRREGDARQREAERQ